MIEDPRSKIQDLRSKIGDWGLKGQVGRCGMGFGRCRVVGGAFLGMTMLSRWAGAADVPLGPRVTICDFNTCVGSVEAADMDDDGDVDVVVTSIYDRIEWWENANGAGTAWIKHIISSTPFKIVSRRKLKNTIMIVCSSNITRIAVILNAGISRGIRKTDFFSSIRGRIIKNN